MWRRLQRAGRTTGGAARGQVSIDAALPAVVRAACSSGPCGGRNAAMRPRAQPQLMFEVGRVRRGDARSVDERALDGRVRVLGANAPAPTASAKMETLRIVTPLLPAAPLGAQRPCARCVA